MEIHLGFSRYRKGLILKLKYVSLEWFEILISFFHETKIWYFELHLAFF